MTSNLKTQGLNDNIVNHGTKMVSIEEILNLLVDIEWYDQKWNKLKVYYSTLEKEIELLLVKISEYKEIAEWTWWPKCFRNIKNEIGNGQKYPDIQMKNENWQWPKIPRHINKKQKLAIAKNIGATFTSKYSDPSS